MSALTEENMEGLVKVSDTLREIVNRVGRAGSWLLVPLVLITMWDVVARKLIWIQVYMVANFGSFFESTLMQEMEWHLHTAVFCMVLGYGYTHNRHVRVDFLRENFKIKNKAKV
jgi:TRAP-type mannitol/chloroaromatic compound transport system permease small subunit